jgi:tryptophan 2,3-dioxygenase
VSGERFKTQDYFPFQSAEFENETTPFKLQYIQTEVMEEENPADYESSYESASSSDGFVESLFREDYLESGEKKQELLVDAVGSAIEGQLSFDAELALFSSETHDQGFSNLLADLASEAEENLSILVLMPDMEQNSEKYWKRQILNQNSISSLQCNMVHWQIILRIRLTDSLHTSNNVYSGI